MSTDLGSPGRRTAGSFRKTFILAVVVLALLAAGLAVGNILQGPRVASTAVNAVGTVEQQGTRLVLTPNQRLREIDPAQVVLEPAAEYSLTQDNGTITVTVIDVYPNGNLLVSGEKMVAINQGNEFIRFSGVINPNNVTAANTVQSTQVADARIEYRGSGFIDESNTMGWLQRFFVAIMPF